MFIAFKNKGGIHKILKCDEFRIRQEAVVAYGKHDICIAWVLTVDGSIFYVECGTDYLDHYFKRTDYD